VKLAAAGQMLMTMQVYFRYVHKAAATKMILFRSDAKTTGVGEIFAGYGLFVQANTDDLIFFASRVNAPDPDFYAQWKSASGSPAMSLTDGKWHHAIVTFSDRDVTEIGQAVMMTIDGKRIFPATPGTGEIAPVHDITYNARCGAVNGETSPDFEIALLNIWSRRLPDREIRLLQADPLMMFRRRTYPIGAVIAAGSFIPGFMHTYKQRRIA